MTFRAVLFDLDGTLLDTLEDLADATNRALADLGLPPRPLANYRYYVGAGLVNLARSALPEGHRDDETVRRCLAGFERHYARNWADKTRPYDGIPELLDALRERRVRLAVCSNKPDSFARPCVERMLPRWHFEAVMGAGDGVPHKPDPTGANLIAQRLGVPPAEFLYVGDTSTDMQTARAAGMFAVGVLWGFRDANELAEHGARVLIAEPKLLLKLL